MNNVRQDLANSLLLNQVFAKDTEEMSYLVPLKFQGIGTVTSLDGYDVRCMIIGPDSSGSKGFVPIPLPVDRADSRIKLLGFAYRNQPIPKSLCMQLSNVLLNRDGALFDNLPWAKWTIDPQKRNRDAAGNPIKDIYHLGKRDAYNRFIGKDWYGSSLSIGNVVARIQYLLQSKEVSNEGMTLDEKAVKMLTRRVLEMEIKESKMALAEAEQQLAILKGTLNIDSIDDISSDETNMHFKAIQSVLGKVQGASESLKERELALDSLINPNKSNHDFVTQVMNQLIAYQESDAPYRGAIGYKPSMDTQVEMGVNSILSYSSPYDLLKEIISDQLNSDLIGVIVENTSLFNGSTILGGALLLKRRGKTITFNADGQKLCFENEKDDYGNDGIAKGTTFIVECDCDEALAMALTCNLNIHMSQIEWETLSINETFKFKHTEEDGIRSLPYLTSKVESIQMAIQGDGRSSLNTKIQVPQNSAGVTFISSSTLDSPVFSTSIPVQSLSEFDILTNQDKAVILSSIESFKGKLPRLRSVKNAVYESSINPLDELLIPLIDESVRREILIRNALRQGNLKDASLLSNQKSKRQKAKEMADMALSFGDMDSYRKWEEEANFYTSLRADVTQDEGEYNSYLDRDEWYERTRQRLAEKNRKKFSNLFDRNT